MRSAVVLAVSLATACELGTSSASSSCTSTATCEPEGLLLHMTWANATPWPDAPVRVSGVVEDAWFDVDCAAGTCALSCRGELAPSTGCWIPLPVADDSDTDGVLVERELEVHARFETRGDGEGPTINVTRHERRTAPTESSDERRWPDDLRLDITGPDGGHRWEFAPPNVNLYAGGAGGPGCHHEVCDGLIRAIVVGLLEPT